MQRRLISRAIIVGLMFLLVWHTASFAVDKKQEMMAVQAIAESGIKGGLVVHVKCGGGIMTTALRINESYMVHGIDTDPEAVANTRGVIEEAGLYGQVSADSFDGKLLPYTDNLVNLLVSRNLGDVTMDEVMRVLCPGGVAYVKVGKKWTKKIKPVPAEIDEWTHYLYDSSNNAVAHDKIVGPPRHLQWVGSPRWSRHHDRMASLTACVSAGGRIFYIFDEGSTASIMLGDKRMLIARDAFNGTILWKQPIKEWHTQMYPYKCGPAQLPRRLVAAGDKVYATLSLKAPLTQLDAATGKILQTYENTYATEEVIINDGVLFLLVNVTPEKSEKKFTIEEVCMHTSRNRVAVEFTWDERPRHVVAIEADSGKVLWHQDYPVEPLTLAADDKSVVFHDGESIVRLNRKTGKQIWRSKPVSVKESIPTNFGATLVLHKDVVLFSGGDRKMASVSMKDGKILWGSKHPPSGHNSPEDLMVINDLVWAGSIAGGRDSGVFTGLDPYTGEVKQEFGPDVKTYWFHHRCYRSKATDNFFMPSRTGIEYIDLETEHWETNHWVRGGCIYGVMPANGLTYAPQHSCSCYIDAKLYGLNAMAPASKSRAVPRDVPNAGRLEKGPAFGKVTSSKTEKNDWPTYRCDASRSGRTDQKVSSKLKVAWEAKFDGKLSSITAANGKAYVAQIDAHKVHAIDTKNGKNLWSYTAGGRVDSPPTIYNGMVLFGSADGYVYSLRVSDGQLVWKFRAAPVDRRTVSFEQVESLWPVNGSVLVENGIVHFVAGRSMFLDGGLRLIRLDAKTGKKISEKILDEIDPETGDNLSARVNVLNMPTALPDVLSSDGEHLYMRTQRFDMEGKRDFIMPTPVTEQDGEGVHLFSGIGFLDGSWFHRGYWTYGKSIDSGASKWFLAGRNAPSARIMCVDDDQVYGFGRTPDRYRWFSPLDYRLFASDKRPEFLNMETGEPATRQEITKLPEKCEVPPTRLETSWQDSKMPILVRAMALAGNNLIVAGPPSILDEDALFENPEDPKLLKQKVQQDKANKGQLGAKLMIVSAIDGKRQAQYDLDSPPCWDAMAVADGKVLISTEDGKVLCFVGK